MKPLPSKLKLAGLSARHLRSVDPDVRKRAYEYCGAEYGILNRELRQQGNLSALRSPLHLSLEKCVVPTHRKLTLWRMTNLEQKLALRDQWVDLAWVSTSMIRKGSECFYNSYRKGMKGKLIRLNMRLEVDLGVDAVHMAALQYYNDTTGVNRKINEYAFCMTEREVVLAPNLHFTVLERTVKDTTHELIVKVTAQEPNHLCR